MKRIADILQSEIGMTVALCLVFVFGCLLAGCATIEVEDRGYEPLLNPDGTVLVDADGKAQLVHKGQIWCWKKHWYEQSAEEIDFSRRPGDDISLTVKNYRDVVSAELTKLVDASLKGAAELAAKVGAAIATAGASVAGEAGGSALKGCISRFLARGGDANAATVTCSDGSCTISDGVVSETCENCIDCKE